MPAERGLAAMAFQLFEGGDQVLAAFRKGAVAWTLAQWVTCNAVSACMKQGWCLAALPGVRQHGLQPIRVPTLQGPVHLYGYYWALLRHTLELSDSTALGY